MSTGRNEDTAPRGRDTTCCESRSHTPLSLRSDTRPRRAWTGSLTRSVQGRGDAQGKVHAAAAHSARVAFNGALRTLTSRPGLDADLYHGCGQS